MRCFLSGLIFCFYLISVPLAASAATIFNHNIQQQVLDHLSIEKSDIKKYKKIFTNLKKHKLSELPELMDQLEDTSLLGTIQALKYLDSKYSSSPEELEYWLQQNQDNPYYQRINKLYQRKSGTLLLNDDDTWLISSAKLSPKYLARLTKQDKSFLIKNTKDFRKYIRQGKTLNARKILDNSKFQNQPWLCQLYHL